jgi:hypothetical protein
MDLQAQLRDGESLLLGVRSHDEREARGGFVVAGEPDQHAQG